jgi:hypothetical protein
MLNGMAQERKAGLFTVRIKSSGDGMFLFIAIAINLF